MKKTLTVVIVAVCLICLAITGTMAIYNKTYDVTVDGGNNITAKTFHIGTTSAQFVNADIAPGETVEWAFNVTNVNSTGKVTKVDMDMTIELILDSKITSLQVSIYDADTDVTIIEPIYGTSNGSFKLPSAFIKNVGSTRDYVVSIIWPANNTENNNNTDTEDSDKTANIKVKVTGTQVIA